MQLRPMVRAVTALAASLGMSVSAAARGDLEGNLWIRTTKIVKGGAVYDLINRLSVLIDRIQVPPGRFIAGFGPGGVVYMGVLDGTIARLERSPVH